MSEKSAVTNVMNAFYNAHVRCFNPEDVAEKWLATSSKDRPPKSHVVRTPKIEGGKDGNLIKKMVAAWGEEQTIAIIERFFVEWRKHNPRVIRLNPDIGSIYSVAPWLQVLPETGHAADPRTNKNVDAALRATRGTR